MEASSVTPDVASEEKALKCLLDTFGSAFSLQDIASAFYNSGRDPNLAGEILCGTQTNPSTNEINVSSVPSTSKAVSQAPEKNGFCETRHANSDSVKASMAKRNPVSMETVSGVIGKKYVWRGAQPNGNASEAKPLKVDASEASIPMSLTVDDSLGLRDANSSRSLDESSLKRDVGLNDDVDDFLFEMLGQGFQLERSAIHDVLGRCGYDMKKSLETLLDLTDEILDKSYDVNTSTNLQAQNQELSERNRFGNNGLRSRQPNGRYEQEKELLNSLFHAPERPDANARTSIKKSSRISRASERTVSEPLEDLSDDIKVYTTRPLLGDIKDEDEDSAYHILRKAVKEHRDTMKEYYRAATEAFASGDRARATLLLEKGKYFYNKAREADEESALKIFETSSGDSEAQDDMSLDLQDHQAREAIQLVKCHLRSLAGIPSIKNLKVMVGTDGRDAERRKRLIIKLLERETIKWTEDATAGTILIRIDEIRPESLSFAKK
ncbi:hypothetical protein vseg_017471 [Gypsophila vaccaria]